MRVVYFIQMQHVQSAAKRALCVCDSIVAVYKLLLLATTVIAKRIGCFGNAQLIENSVHVA